MKTLGRNDPCWCQSGKKYKKCHLGTPADTQRQSLRDTYGEFGAKTMQKTLESVYKDKQAGTLNTKGELNSIISKIFEEKRTGKRARPSTKLILGKSKLSAQTRKDLIDLAAEIVDQNWCGRSEMCVLFAILIADALKKLGMNPKVIIGEGTYSEENKSSNSFTWNHSWVVLEDEIIDGNVDSMIENPVVPKGIEPSNYWGAIMELPKDRTLIPDKEINEDWIRENTTYSKLQEWRQQLYQKLESIQKS